MKILITGGTGFLGTNIAERLCKKNSITLLDKISKDRMTEDFFTKNKDKDIRFVEADILDEKEIRNVFRDNDYGAVIHLAGKSDVRESVKNIAAFEAVNVRGTLNVLDACNDYGTKKIIFASSSSVYGNMKKEKFLESDNTDKQASPYGATKKMAEICCNLYNSLYGLDILAFRFFTVYGPRGRLNMAVMRFIQSIDKGSVIEVHGDGKIRRDFIYVDDIIDAIEMSLKKKFGFDTLNIGSGKSHDLNYLVNLVEKDLGKKAKKKYIPIQKGDVFSTMASIEKAEKLLGWKPKTSLEDGIKKTAAWWKSGGSRLY